MDKKASSYMWLVGLILVIFGAIVVIMFFYEYKTGIEGGIDSAGCKTSIMWVSASRKLPFVDLVSNLKNSCKPIRLEINKESFDEANKKIADILIDCALIGEKYLDLLPLRSYLLIDEKISFYGFKCADVIFSNKAVDNYEDGKPVLEKEESFRKWLSDNEIRKDTSYSFYFSSLKNTKVKIPLEINASIVYSIYLTKILVDDEYFNVLKDEIFRRYSEFYPGECNGFEEDMLKFNLVLEPLKVFKSRKKEKEICVFLNY